MADGGPLDSGRGGCVATVGGAAPCAASPSIPCPFRAASREHRGCLRARTVPDALVRLSFMNIRDPFDLRRTAPLAFLQSGARFAFQSASKVQIQIENQLELLGRSRTTSPESPRVEQSMAFPQSGSHNNPWPEPEESHDYNFPMPGYKPMTMSSSEKARRPNGEGQGMLAAFLGKNEELPMYKDKPYNYSTPRRSFLSRFMRQDPRFLAIEFIVFVLALFLLGVFGSQPLSTKQVFSLLNEAQAERKKGGATWEVRQQAVKASFRESWSAYERYAWGEDEFHPISKKGRQMVPGGMGWIIVDALDTMILMNLTSELAYAREWISTKLDYDKDHDVNTFETTIRMLGGLLAADYLTTEFPDMAPLSNMDSTGGEDLYREKASDLADRLLGAYESKSGVPYASVNLRTRAGIPSHDDGGASSTAEAATLQLEMKYLANITGEVAYWEAAERAMQVIDDNGAKDGLVPIYINADQGTFQGNNIRLGSRGDSYYEYLIKQYLQTSKAEPIYLEMWEQALEGVKKHLISYSKAGSLTILGERPSGLDQPLSPKMDHLVCFMPGTIALAVTGGSSIREAKLRGAWGKRQEEDMDLAKQLMKTCWAMYKGTTTGLAAEITHFQLRDPPLRLGDVVPRDDAFSQKSPHALDPSADAAWRRDLDVKPNDRHNLQRPETVESLLYLWRITGDPMYRQWGWEMFEAFEAHTRCGGGYSSINNVMSAEPSFRDNMESFWLAETLKYFYLLFGPNDVLPLDRVVLNTEAHPLPRFEIGKLLATGWKRKPRDREGATVKEGS